MILALADLISILQLSLRNTVLFPYVSRKIICALDPLSPDTHAPFNWTIYTVIVVHGEVVPVEGLLRLKGSSPRAIQGFVGKFARGAGMRSTKTVMDIC